LAGLGPAIHAFLPVGGVDGEDVGGRNKSGHGELKLCGRLEGVRLRATKDSPGNPPALHCIAGEGAERSSEAGESLPGIQC
jgi:hypothetical protein